MTVTPERVVVVAMPEATVVYTLLLAEVTPDRAVFSYESHGTELTIERVAWEAAGRPTQLEVPITSSLMRVETEWRTS